MSANPKDEACDAPIRWDYPARWARIQSALARRRADAFVVRQPGNIRYLACAAIPGSPALSAVIVATGPHSAFSHHVPGTRKIAGGDAVICDFGVYVQGYASDISRTILVGKASKWNGVYLPGQGGVRIEDAVLVTEDGVEWLTGPGS